MSALGFTPHAIVAANVGNTRPPRQDQLDAFARQEIDAWSVAGRPRSGEYGVGFARTQRLADGRFEFVEDGTPSMVVIALDVFGDPSDLVAWPLRQEWIAAWIGRASMLGAQHIDGPRMGDALTIYDKPMAWLRAGREGVVLVDRQRGARELREAGTILAAGGLEHAAQLVALLTAPPPKVLVPVDEGERHAA